MNRDAVRAALEAIISDLDYDLHKELLCSEDSEDDVYPDITTQFINAYLANGGIA